MSLHKDMETIFLDEFSKEVWQTTYKHHTDNTIDDTLRRIAKAVASVETGSDETKRYWERCFYQLLTGFKLCAGGRIIANAGTDWKGVTLMNCFVGPKPKYDQDSIEGIYSVLLSQSQTLKSEGGWGMNFSFIRPRGAFIHGIGVESPGVVKFMEIFDTASAVITAGSGKKSKKFKGKDKIRKGAMMGILDIWHPSIVEFINAKRPFIDDMGKEAKRLQKFNLSVNCCDEFMEKIVALDQLNAHPETPQKKEAWDTINKWELVFPDTRFEKYKQEWDGNITLWKSKGYPVVVYETVGAWELWSLIMDSTYKYNDPGILFLDRANKTHCWNYAGPECHIASTNPCGEQCLPFGAVCNLASLNLTQFVKNGVLDIQAIEKYVPVAVRFLDNVNDLTKAPLPEYEDSIRKRRRIGLGVMGWGSALYMMKTRFGSKKAEEIKEELMSRICYAAVKASIELAKEKGPFIGCVPEKHARSYFFDQINLPKEIRDKIAKYGIRNSALFSIQPTGNTSVLANVVSGGIEPVFAPEYIRTVIIDTLPTTLKDKVPKYWEGEFAETSTFKFAKEGNDTILKANIDGIVYKIDKNRGLTKEVPCQDYGVRILAKKDQWDNEADWAATASNLRVGDHLKDMIGFAKWVDSSISKTVNLSSDYPYSEFFKLYLKAYQSGVLKGITTYRDGTMMSVLSTPTSQLANTKAPKRPEKLDGELHHFVIDGRKYYAAVGLWDGTRQPYEIFTGVNLGRKELFIPKNIRSGVIQKIKRGEYVFIDSEGEHYELTNGHSNDTADALTRMISGGLRHGMDISFVVHQLEKTEGPMICFSKVLARTLKRYIKDGTAIAGEECPVCGKSMVRKEGCATCEQCGHSKCS